MQLTVIQSDPLAGPGVLEAPLRLRGAELNFTLPFKGDDIPALDGADGVIVLGGQTMPDQDDEVPFLEPIRDLLRSAIENDVPALGLCLGAELLCQAAGGDVRRLEGPEIGWIPLSRGEDADDDPIFGDLEAEHQAFAYHSYALEPPPEAAILARHDDDVHALRVGECAWGILPHPEHALPVLSILFAENRDEVADAGVDLDRLRAESARRQAASAAFGEELAHRFADQVLMRRVGSGVRER